jgi:hypothetical protein
MSEDKEKISKLVVHGLVSRPVYLLLFGLGVIGIGALGSVGLLSKDEYFPVFSAGVMTIYMIIVAAVAFRIETAQMEDRQAIVPDWSASKRFSGGENAGKMSGNWVLDWSCNENPDKDKAVVIAGGSSIFGTVFDDENFQNYWFLGRLDEEGNFSILFWNEGGVGPMGCAFLERRANNFYDGTWKGLGKDGVMKTGNMSLTRAVR